MTWHHDLDGVSMFYTEKAESLLPFKSRSTEHEANFEVISIFRPYIQIVSEMGIPGILMVNFFKWSSLEYRFSLGHQLTSKHPMDRKLFAN